LLGDIGGVMEYKAWEFENDWYISINKGLTFCMNQEAACLELIKAIARVRYLEDEIRGLLRRMAHEPELNRIPNTEKELP
jgi:hypothetical protein